MNSLILGYNASSPGTKLGIKDIVGVSSLFPLLFGELLAGNIRVSNLFSNLECCYISMEAVLNYANTYCTHKDGTNPIFYSLILTLKKIHDYLFVRSKGAGLATCINFLSIIFYMPITLTQLNRKWEFLVLSEHFSKSFSVKNFIKASFFTWGSTFFLFYGAYYISNKIRQFLMAPQASINGPLPLSLSTDKTDSFNQLSHVIRIVCRVALCYTEFTYMRAIKCALDIFSLYTLAKRLWVEKTVSVQYNPVMRINETSSVLHSITLNCLVTMRASAEKTCSICYEEHKYTFTTCLDGRHTICYPCANRSINIKFDAQNLCIPRRGIVPYFTKDHMFLRVKAYVRENFFSICNICRNVSELRIDGTADISHNGRHSAIHVNVELLKVVHDDEWNLLIQEV